MNLSELTLKTAQISGISRKDVDHVLKTAGDVIAASLAEGVEVTLHGLGKAGIGKLYVKERAARNGRNPKTGAAIEIQASKSAAFKASTALKDAILA